jgi:hypothetical protein
MQLVRQEETAAVRRAQIDQSARELRHLVLAATGRGLTEVQNDGEHVVGHGVNTSGNSW